MLHSHLTNIFSVECNLRCSRKPNPVCGSDGLTYTNWCQMKLAGCRWFSFVNYACAFFTFQVEEFWCKQHEKLLYFEQHWPGAEKCPQRTMPSRSKEARWYELTPSFPMGKFVVNMQQHKGLCHKGTALYYKQLKQGYIGLVNPLIGWVKNTNSSLSFYRKCIQHIPNIEFVPLSSDAEYYA